MPVRRRPTPSFQGDPLIPILNLVCMLIPLLLYGAVFIRYQTLQVNAPNTETTPFAEQQPSDSLRLTVIITDRGFHLKTNPVHKIPWMNQVTGSQGPDIPVGDGGWNYEQLARRLAEIKREHAKERSLIIGAEDDVPFDVLIKTMDCARTFEHKELFPEVTLTRGIVS